MSSGSFICHCGYPRCKVLVSRTCWYRHQARIVLAENIEGKHDDLPEDHDDPLQAVEVLDDAEYAQLEAHPEQREPAAMVQDPTMPGWTDPVTDPNSPASHMILAEVMLIYFETISVFKAKAAMAKGIYMLMKCILPAGSNLGTYSRAKNMLETLHNQRVLKVDLCPKDCIAYYDCQHPKMSEYKHAHRTWCPHCGADRKITVGGITRSAKAGYYIALGPWFRDIFAQNDLKEDRSQTQGPPAPPGHVTKSHGWHNKITANPNMNADHRNQALIGMSDGVPLFKDMNASSVTPIAFRCANMSHSQSIQFKNIHLAALYPHEFWRDNRETGTWIKVRRKPKSLTPMMNLVIDDLLTWEDGVTMTDTSLPINDHSRTFLLKACLLYWCGDYPGLGETTGWAHSGKKQCHYCEHNPGPKSSGLQRLVHGNYRRYNNVSIFVHVCV
jgi:hypothetical protein